MSVLSCATFLLILVASLENACSARPGVFDATGSMAQYEANPSDHPNLIKKKDGLNINLTDAQGTSKHQAASTVRKSSNNNDSSNKEEEVYVMTRRHRRHKHSSRKKNSHQGGGIKVTYTVPQKSDEDQQQSFTLDYSPPKVHPPHHN